MSDLLTRLQILFAHTEAVEGTADGAFAGTDAILAMNLNTRNVPRDFHERSFQGQMGPSTGVIGAIPPVPLSFDTEIYGNGTTTVPQVSSLLKSTFGTLNTDSIDTTATGGSSTVITLAATAGATVGNGLLVETAVAGVYELAFITSIANNTSITVAPALSFSPVNGARLKFTTTYTSKNTGHPSLSFGNYLNNSAGASQWITTLGARGNLKFAAKKAGDIPTASWAFQGWNWAQATSGTVPSSISYGAGLPPVALATLFKLGGTQTNIFDLEWDLGNTVTPKFSQNSTYGIYGMPVTGRTTKGSFRVHASSSSVAPFTSWVAGTETTLSQQFGNTRFGTAGWYAPHAQRTEVKYGDDSGVTSNDVTWNANISAGEDSFYFAVG
jgi:hypothetical protein